MTLRAFFFLKHHWYEESDHACAGRERHHEVASIVGHRIWGWAGRNTPVPTLGQEGRRAL